MVGRDYFFFTTPELLTLIGTGLGAIAVIAIGVWIFWPRRPKPPGFPVVPWKKE